MAKNPPIITNVQIVLVTNACFFFSFSLTTSCSLVCSVLLSFDGVGLEVELNNSFWLGVIEVDLVLTSASTCFRLVSFPFESHDIRIG